MDRYVRACVYWLIGFSLTVCFVYCWVIVLGQKNKTRTCHSERLLTSTQWIDSYHLGPGLEKWVVMIEVRAQSPCHRCPGFASNRLRDGSLSGQSVPFTSVASIYRLFVQGTHSLVPRSIGVFTGQGASMTSLSPSLFGLLNDCFDVGL